MIPKPPTPSFDPLCGAGGLLIAALRAMPDVGALCANCGTALTEEEIKKQAIKVAEERARAAFKNFKL